MADDTHPIPAVGVSIWIRIHRSTWIVAEVVSIGADGVIGSLDDEGSAWDSPLEDRGTAWRPLEDPPPPPAITSPDRDTVLRLLIAGAKAERDRVIDIVARLDADIADGSWVHAPSLVEKIEAGAPSLDPCADAITRASEVPRV